MRGIRNAFFAGLLFCLPVGVTVFVVQFLVDFAGKPARTHVADWVASFAEKIGQPEMMDGFWAKQGITVLSALIVVVAVTLVGLLSRYLLGKWLIEMFENIIKHVPFIKTVYSSIKEIVTRFGEENKKNFKQVVLVQFPHPAVWTVGFVTNSEPSEISEKLGAPVLHVFVPTTPNPTGGYFMLFRKEDVLPLSMNVADAMKLVISGGALLPAYTPAADAALADAGKDDWRDANPTADAGKDDWRDANPTADAAAADAAAKSE